MHTQSVKYLLIVVLLGCASEPSKLVLVDLKDERIMTLEEQIADKDKELDTLRNKVAQLEAFKIPAKPKSRMPVQKLRANLATDNEPRASDDERKIADSNDESMHLYFKGLEKMRERKFDSALEDFRQFLALSPGHVYADRAQFLIAECHFLTREYGLTIVSTNLLISRYPHSVKIPDAMLQRAIAYLEMKQTELGRNALTDILKKYPTEPVADQASKRLAQLNVESVPLIEDANSEND